MGQIRFRDDSGMIRIGERDEDVIHYHGTTYKLSEVDVLPPTAPSKMILVGRNLRDSVDAIGVDPPSQPRLFFVPPSAVVGHGGTVTLPMDKQQVVFGAELGVVIGQQCKHVSEERAMDVVQGFTCVNDISNSDDKEIDPGFARVKGFDNSKPIGPEIVDKEDVPTDAEIELRRNGETEQRSTLSNLVFDIPEIIEEVSSYFTLERGDIIAMGSPAGNAPLADGDTVEIDIEGIGTLRHGVKRE